MCRFRKMVSFREMAIFATMRTFSLVIRSMFLNDVGAKVQNKENRPFHQTSFSDILSIAVKWSSRKKKNKYL